MSASSESAFTTSKMAEHVPESPKYSSMSQTADTKSDAPVVSSAVCSTVISGDDHSTTNLNKSHENLEEIFPGFHETLQTRHSSHLTSQTVTMEDRAKIFQHLPLEARERIRQKTLQSASKDDLVNSVRQILIEYLGEANFSESCRQYLERGLSSCAPTRNNTNPTRSYGSRSSNFQDSDGFNIVKASQSQPTFSTRESPGPSVQSPEEGPGSSPQEQVAQSTTDIDEDHVGTSSYTGRQRCPSGVSTQCSNWLNSIQTSSTSSSIDESNNMATSASMPSSSSNANPPTSMSTTRYESNQSDTFLGLTRKTEKHTNNSLLIKLLYESNDIPRTDSMSVSSTQSPLAGDAWSNFNSTSGLQDGDQGIQQAVSSRHRFVSGSPTSSCTPSYKVLPSTNNSNSNRGRQSNGELCRLLENSPPANSQSDVNAAGDTSIFDFTDVSTTSTVTTKTANARKRKSPLASQTSSSHSHGSPSPKRVASDKLQRMLTTQKQNTPAQSSVNWEGVRSPNQNNRILSQLLSSSEAPTHEKSSASGASGKNSSLISEAVKRPKENLSNQQLDSMNFINSGEAQASNSNPPSLTPNAETPDNSEKKPIVNVASELLSSSERSPFDWDFLGPDFDLDNYIKELDNGTAQDSENSQQLTKDLSIEYDDALDTFDPFNSLLFSGVENSQESITEVSSGKHSTGVKVEASTSYPVQEQRSAQPPASQHPSESLSKAPIGRTEQQRKLEEVNINLEDLDEILRQDESTYPKIMTSGSKLNMQTNYPENYRMPPGIVASESEREVNRIKQELSSIIPEGGTFYDQRTHAKNAPISYMRAGKNQQGDVEQQLNYGRPNLKTMNLQQDITGISQRQNIIHSDFAVNPKLGGSTQTQGARAAYTTQYSQDRENARLAADRQRLIERQEQQQFQSRMSSGGSIYSHSSHVSHQQPLNPGPSGPPNKAARPLFDNFAKLMKEVGPNVNVQTQQPIQPRYSQSIVSTGSDSGSAAMSNMTNQTMKGMMPHIHHGALPAQQAQFSQSQTQQHLVRPAWEQPQGLPQHLPGNILNQVSSSQAQQDIPVARAIQSSPIVNQDNNTNSVVPSGNASYSHNPYHLSEGQSTNPPAATSRPQAHSPGFNVRPGPLAISPNTPASSNLPMHSNIGNNSRQVKNELRQMVANRSTNQQHQLASQLSSSNSKTVSMNLPHSSTPNIVNKNPISVMTQPVSSANPMIQLSNSNAVMQKQRMYMQQQQHVRLQQQTSQPPPPPRYPTIHQPINHKMQQPGAQSSYPPLMPADRMSASIPRQMRPELIDSIQQQRLYHHQQQQQYAALHTHQRIQQTQPARLMTQMTHSTHPHQTGILIGQINSNQPQPSNQVSNDALLTSLLINQSGGVSVQSSISPNMSVPNCDPLVVSSGSNVNSSRMTTASSESELPDYIADTLFDLENSISTSSALQRTSSSITGIIESSIGNYRPQNLSNSSPLSSINPQNISTSNHFDISQEYQFSTGNVIRDSLGNNSPANKTAQSNNQQQPKQCILEQLLSNNSNS